MKALHRNEPIPFLKQQKLRKITRKSNNFLIKMFRVIFMKNKSQIHFIRTFYISRKNEREIADEFGIDICVNYHSLCI